MLLYPSRADAAFKIILPSELSTSFSSLPRGNHVSTLRLVTKAGITDQHRKVYLLWFNACTQKAIVALGRIDVLPTQSSDRTISLIFATFLNI